MHNLIQITHSTHAEHAQQSNHQKTANTSLIAHLSEATSDSPTSINDSTNQQEQSNYGFVAAQESSNYGAHLLDSRLLSEIFLSRTAKATSSHSKANFTGKNPNLASPGACFHRNWQPWLALPKLNFSQEPYVNQLIHRLVNDLAEIRELPFSGNEYEDRYRDLKHELNELYINHYQLLAAKDHLNRNFIKISDQFRANERKTLKLEKEFTKLTSVHGEQDKKIDKLQRQNEKLKNDTKAKESKTRINDLENQNKLLTKEAKQLLHKLTELEHSNQKLEAKNRDLVEHKREVEAKLEKINGKFLSLSDAFKHLEQQRITEKSRDSQVSPQVSASILSPTQDTKLLSKYQALEAKYERLKEKYKQADKELKTVKVENSILREKNCDLIKRGHELKYEVAMAQLKTNDVIYRDLDSLIQRYWSDNPKLLFADKDKFTALVLNLLAESAEERQARINEVLHYLSQVLNDAKSLTQNAHQQTG
jgi:predicted  nucleic acid-binding Zn-ribbon protein